MLQVKLLEKYPSIAELEKFKNRLNVRTQKYGQVGNKVSLAYKKLADVIGEVLYNEDNFLQCDICMEQKSKAEVTENFDNDLSVCSSCEQYYVYCTACNKPLYCEDYNNKIINDELYCKNCYFDERETLLNGWNIEDIKLKELELYFKLQDKAVNVLSMKNITFKIKGHYFTIEAHNGIRLGSWGANFWADICSNEKNILGGIDFFLQENNSYIEDIKIGD